MVNYVWVAIYAAIGYLVGATPNAYLIAKFLKGIDIREHGSGNPGATNVFRVVGKTAGIVTFGLDFLKGFLPVQIALWLMPGNTALAATAGLAARRMLSLGQTMNASASSMAIAMRGRSRPLG